MVQQQRRLPSSDETTCPVSDVVLSRLYRAESGEVTRIALELSDDVRARLSIFCYSRAHLRKIGAEVAAACDPATISLHAGPTLGASIVAARMSAMPKVFSSTGRARVTLATADDMRRRVGAPVVDDMVIDFDIED